MIQRIFEAPHPSETRLARRYVEANYPLLVGEFLLILESPKEVDLYNWLKNKLGVTMHDIYDWDDGLKPSIQGLPLQLGGEDVRGTSDLPDLSDDEMEEFRIGLGESDFTSGEIELLNELLLERQAPHDRKRRRVLAEFAGEQAMFADQEDLSDEEPYLEGSDEEQSGTDTDGSDTEDDESFEDSETRAKRSAARLSRESRLLKPASFIKKLKSLSSKDEQARRESIFEKGTRPKKKRFFRKEAKLKIPNSTVGERTKIPVKPSKEQIQDLAQLNALLELGIPIAVAEQLVTSKFVVAQYRGLFYSRKAFDKRSRERHRELDERERPIFSSSALAEGRLGTSGYYYLYSAPDRDEALQKYQRQLVIEGQRIRHALLALREQKSTEEARKSTTRSTENFQPLTMSDISTHFYSEDLDGYYKELAESRSRNKVSTSASKPLDPIFKGLPNDSNPKVSTGDVPVHAARYAYGLKPYEGHEEEVLDPEYDSTGKPKHPYSGKIYVAVHPLSDYEEEKGPSQLVPLQNEGRINISKMIIPERESQFEGMVEEGRVQHQMKAKFPDFSKPYKKVHAEKYGLSPELFQAFKTAFNQAKPGSDEMIFIESLLSNYLSRHSELLAIEAALEEAASRRALLVYRTGVRSFGLEPPPILKQEQAKKAREEKKESKPPDIVELLKQLTSQNLVFKKGWDASPSTVQAAPLDLRAQVGVSHGNIIGISGSDIACFIRSLVTAAAVVHGIIEVGQIENIVKAIQEHLEFVRLRTRGQMINAGGLVAAEVRRALTQLTRQAFDPEVHVVMWDGSVGQVTEFTVNTGTQAVWLFYTPGHFDLIDRS